MWKKDDAANEPGTPARDPEPSTSRSRGARESRQSATIGRSITVKGEVTGDEDLLIEGHIDGSVNLKEHAVTVGAEGQVEANVTARLITVEGHVEGNLTAHDQVVLRASARVEGDITAPRVVLEDGARFRGGIDMGDLSDRKSGSSSGSARSGGGTSSASKGGSTGTESGTSTSSGSGSGKQSSGGAGDSAASKGAKGVTA
ncbi:MAG: polymer-forming cytoskeletal protein [Gemmatimonadales bacterium]|nr:MAG: polymer-forming cytoskeletal protein [Gemmatimonadales bacterium]